MKELGIMVYFNKKDKSKTSETGNCQTGNEAGISKSIASVEQTTIRVYSHKLSVTEESKKRKREFVRQYDKKYLELGFIIATCSEQSQCVVCPLILLNDAMKPFRLSRHFYSKHNKQNYVFQKLL